MLAVSQSASIHLSKSHSSEVIISYFSAPFLLALTSSTRVSFSLGPYASTALSVLASHAAAVILLTAKSSGLLHTSNLLCLKLRISVKKLRCSRVIRKIQEPVVARPELLGRAHPLS